MTILEGLEIYASLYICVHCPSVCWLVGSSCGGYINVNGYCVYVSKNLLTFNGKHIDFVNIHFYMTNVCVCYCMFFIFDSHVGRFLGNVFLEISMFMTKSI